MLRLKEKYQKEVISFLKERFGYKDDMAVPHMEKVVINVGFGKLIAGKTGEEQRKVIEGILNDLSLIAGQKPVLTAARKSIAGFKVREGQPIGAKVTLRRKKMYDFLERLIHVALARSRDFRGIDPNSVDEKGNLTIGVKEHITFPEVFPEKVKTNFGLEITVVTTAKKREEGLELLKSLGLPIKK